MKNPWKNPREIVEGAELKALIRAVAVEKEQLHEWELNIISSVADSRALAKKLVFSNSICGGKSGRIRRENSAELFLITNIKRRAFICFRSNLKMNLCVILFQNNKYKLKQRDDFKNLLKT